MSCSFLEIEEVAGLCDIVEMWLVVEGDVISGHWAMELRFSGATKGLDGVVEIWHEAFDSLIFVLDQALGGCGRDDAMLKIPAKVLDNYGNHMKINDSLQKLVGSGMNTVIIEGVAGCLKHKSFSKGMGEAEDIITDQGSPDIKELLSLLEHEVLHL